MSRLIWICSVCKDICVGLTPNFPPIIFCKKKNQKEQKKKKKKKTQPRAIDSHLVAKRTGIIYQNKPKLWARQVRANSADSYQTPHSASFRVYTVCNSSSRDLDTPVGTIYVVKCKMYQQVLITLRILVADLFSLKWHLVVNRLVSCK